MTDKQISGVTVSELKTACEALEDIGLGNKVVLISNDDEGNGFHTLYYLFVIEEEDIMSYEEAGDLPADNDPQDVVILG